MCAERQNPRAVRSEEISRDIAGLEQELAGLRSRVENDTSTFSTLEAQVADLKQSLSQTLQTVKETESRLSERQSDLAQAQKEEAIEAYQDLLETRRQAGSRVSARAAELLSELDAYDDRTLAVRKLLEQMREMPGNEERIAEVETDLADEPGELRHSWEAVMAAVKWRLDARRDEELTAEATRGVATEDLPEDLQKLAQERRRTRIKEYFAKT
jgi:predicted  nucleic acid-binding Zn-ribbon protein